MIRIGMKRGGNGSHEAPKRGKAGQGTERRCQDRTAKERTGQDSEGKRTVAGKSRDGHNGKAKARAGQGRHEQDRNIKGNREA